MGKLKNIIKNWRKFMKKLCLIGLLFFAFIGSAYCEWNDIYYDGNFLIEAEYEKNSTKHYLSISEVNEEILFYGLNSLSLDFEFDEDYWGYKIYINEIKQNRPNIVKNGDKLKIEIGLVDHDTFIAEKTVFV